MINSLAHQARRPVLLAALALAAASVFSADTMLVSAPSAATPVSTLLRMPYEHRATVAVREPASPRAVAGPFTYRWPVKPFNRQHPVRGFFGDPRISNHGESHQFHFGVDISAPNGTAVYATITGSAYIHPLHSTTVVIVDPRGVEFSYWHVVPSVRNGQLAIAYETVIGRIEAPYGHVHFSEAKDGRYLNPLRPGAMGPFVDDTQPRVTSVREHGGQFALVA